MPVPTSISDLSTTASANFPSGTDTPGILDDVQRALSAFIAQLRDGRLPLDGSLAMTGVLQAFGGGIKFPSTQIPSADPNVIDDYETHGSWTPIDASGAGIGFTSALGRYVKDGNRIWIGGAAQYPVIPNGGTLAIGGIPFAGFTGFAQVGGAWVDGFASPTAGVIDSGATNLKVRNLATGVNLINNQASGLTVYFNLCYLTTN